METCICSKRFLCLVTLYAYFVPCPSSDRRPQYQWPYPSPNLFKSSPIPSLNGRKHWALSLNSDITSPKTRPQKTPRKGGSSPTSPSHPHPNPPLTSHSSPPYHNNPDLNTHTTLQTPTPRLPRTPIINTSTLSAPKKAPNQNQPPDPPRHLPHKIIISQQQEK